LGQIFGQRSLDFTQGGDQTTMQPPGPWIAAPEALMKAAIIVRSDFCERSLMDTRTAPARQSVRGRTLCPHGLSPLSGASWSAFMSLRACKFLGGVYGWQVPYSLKFDDVNHNIGTLAAGRCYTVMR